jgi:hypothetical protein
LVPSLSANTAIAFSRVKVSTVYPSGRLALTLPCLT